MRKSASADATAVVFSGSSVSVSPVRAYVNVGALPPGAPDTSAGIASRVKARNTDTNRRSRGCIDLPLNSRRGRGQRRASPEIFVSVPGLLPCKYLFSLFLQF